MTKVFLHMTTSPLFLMKLLTSISKRNYRTIEVLTSYWNPLSACGARNGKSDGEYLKFIFESWLIWSLSQNYKLIEFLMVNIYN